MIYNIIERGHPCRTPLSMRKDWDMFPFTFTCASMLLYIVSIVAINFGP